MKTIRTKVSVIAAASLAGTVLLAPAANAAEMDSSHDKPSINVLTQELELNGVDPKTVVYGPAPKQISPMALGKVKTAGKCKYRHGGDDPQYKTSEHKVSAHGWWVKAGGSGCSAKAKVKTRLQAWGCLSGIGCDWTTVLTSKAKSLKPGTGKRANVRASCISSKTVGWRNQVDVDLEWKIDPFGWDSLGTNDLKCNPGA